MIPFGASSSLEGHVHTTPVGGVVIDLSTMTDILCVNDAPDMTARVQAGVTRQSLDSYLRSTGLFFPVDPGADATIGGMAATNASGTTTVMYGNMKSNVLGMTVVLPDGRIIRTGTQGAKKSSAGYDLTRLLIGSEGTLGVITELLLQLSPLPSNVETGVFSFPTIKNAVDTCADIMQCALPVARMELLDENAIAATNSYSRLENPVAPSLLVELHNCDESNRDFVSTLATERDCQSISWGNNPSQVKKLWEARHNAWYGVKNANVGRVGLSTDVCVPVSKLADVIVQTQEDLRNSELDGTTGIVGHVGDGNFHVFIYTDENDRKSVLDFYDRLIKRALAVGGTCTGEHGIGNGKMKYLKQEFGEDVVNVMHSIKKALDPLDLMNPGKIFYG